MIRTRFAPSPTGYLHIGGARTALFCWLFSKKMGGQFILRVEDTDRERSTEESVNAILNAMEWLDLDYDEGPIFQTERFDRYRAVIQQLVDAGQAYYCACSKERLESLREQQMANKQKPRYDGCCRDKGLQPGDAQHLVVRFKNPLQGEVEFNDLVKGAIRVSNSELDDLIIARSDGTPTYNLTVVIDDMDMNITHVVRGSDHVTNTATQIQIIAALGGTVPSFAHHSLLTGPQGEALSKRLGTLSLRDLRAQGVEPMAILSLMARLGSSDPVELRENVAEVVAGLDGVFAFVLTDEKTGQVLAARGFLVFGPNYRGSDNLGNALKDQGKLEEALEARSAGLVYLHIDPAYDSLHDDPRFADIVSRVGLKPG